MPLYTVIIVHHRRERNLHFTLEGLRFQDHLPSEVIVVTIGDTPVIEQNYPYKLTMLPYKKDWKFLPIAGSRNLGAQRAQTNLLVFLDVDCIPAMDFCSYISEKARITEGLVMGSPRYMLVKRSDNQHYLDLRNLSIPHPARPIVQDLHIEDCYELFWSLCFAIPKRTFNRIGGFDESYEGYAIEDTDFALKAKMEEIPFFLCSKEVFHQQHQLCIPPLNHLESIVANCNRFYMKWGYWPLRDCLTDFRELGYVEWNRKQTKPIEILKIPTGKQIKKHLVENAPYR